MLFDLNRTVNEEIGREIFDITGFKKNVDHDIEILYRNVSLLTNLIKLQNPFFFVLIKKPFATSLLVSVLSC